MPEQEGLNVTIDFNAQKEISPFLKHILEGPVEMCFWTPNGTYKIKDEKHYKLVNGGWEPLDV
jgi:hypothetical protein